jgi:hypothetical protein
MRGRGTVSLPPLTSGAPVLVKGSSCGLMPAVQGEPWVRQGLTQSQVEHIQLSRSIASLPKGGRAARPSNWLPSCCQQLGTSETDRCVCVGGGGCRCSHKLGEKSDLLQGDSVGSRHRPLNLQIPPATGNKYIINTGRHTPERPLFPCAEPGLHP